MRRWLACLLAVAGLGVGAAHAADPLGEYHWRNRLLLFYVPGADVPALASFREAVDRRSCGMDDRDLVVGTVIGDDAGVLGGRSLEAGEARVLRRMHGIGAQRTATVLVGKDGGVKMDVDGVAAIDRVFQRIDGMPMRKQEMAERGADPCE